MIEEELEPDYSPEEIHEERKREREETSSESEDALAEVRRVRKLRKEEQVGDKTKEETKILIPDRIREALEGSRTFNEYKQNRVFRFLHLFSGRRDVLGREILKTCKMEGINAEVCALDREREGGPDMLADQPYQDLLKDAAKGDFDALRGTRVAASRG